MSTPALRAKKVGGPWPPRVWRLCLPNTIPFHNDTDKVANSECSLVPGHDWTWEGASGTHCLQIATEFYGNQLRMYRLHHKLTQRGFRMCSVLTSLICCYVPSSSCVCWWEAWERVHWLHWVCAIISRKYAHGKRFMMWQAYFAQLFLGYPVMYRSCRLVQA